MKDLFKRHLNQRLTSVLVSFVAAFVVTYPCSAWSVRFAVPGGLNGELVLTNHENSEIVAYQKNPFVPLSDLPWEEEIRLPANASKTYDLKKLPSPVQFVSNSKMSVFVRTLRGTRIPLPEGIANVQTLNFGKGEEVSITNLSAIPQTAQMSWSGGKARFDLEPYQTLVHSLGTISGRSFRIEGEAALSAVLSGTQPQVFRPTINPMEPARPASGALFVLATEGGGMQFVARIESAELIEKARRQIAKPDEFMGRILVAEIATGSNGENQNLASPFRTWWSWHVKTVFGFAQVASQSCDGNPQFVEDILPTWINMNGPGSHPVICFWSYRVIREL